MTGSEPMVNGNIVREVRLDGFETFAVLIGSGEARPDGGKLLLSGSFAIRFADWFESEFETIVPEKTPVVIEKCGAAFYLKQSNAIRFEFRDGGELRLDNGRDPVAQTNAVQIGRPIDSGPVLVNLLNLVVGLLPGTLSNNDANHLVYPTTSGSGKVRLSATKHPDLAVVGYWLLSDGGGYSIQCGEVSYTTELSSVPNISASLFASCQLRMVLPTRLTSRIVLGVSGYSGGDAGLIRVEQAAGAAFLTRSQGREDLIDEVAASALEISGGWLSVTEFAAGNGGARDDGLRVAKRYSVGPKELGYTRIDSKNSTTIQFHLWLNPRRHPKRIGDSSLPAPRALFVYHDAKVAQGRLAHAPDRLDRYTGLRIRGFGHIGARQVKLDGDWIWARLDEAGESPEFVFEAGQENVAIPEPDDRGDGGHAPPSAAGDFRVIRTTKLMPKPESLANPARRARVPTGSVMSISLGQNARGRDPSLSFSSADGRITVRDADLFGPPNGVTARQPAIRGVSLVGSEPTAEWNLRLNSELLLKADDYGVFPEGGPKWTERFHGDEQKFDFMEYPGSGIVMDPSPGPHLRADAEDVSGQVATTRDKSQLSIRQANDRELMVYTQVFTNLVYRLIENFIPKSDDVVIRDDQINLGLSGLLRDTTPWFPSYLPRNFGVDDLLTVFYCGRAAPVDAANGAREGVVKFLDSNVVRDPGKKKILWPFLPGIAVTLARKKEDGAWENFWDIAPGKDPAAVHSGFAFDLSTKGGAGIKGDDPLLPANAEHPDHAKVRDLGWTVGSDFIELAKRYPMIWPEGGDSGSAKRLDPRNRRWRGILFRDMPMELNLPPVLADSKLLKDLVSEIEKKLVMQFGWKDESGSTWAAGIDTSSEPIDFTPNGWKDFVHIALVRFRTTGAAGVPMTTEGTLRFELPLIQVEEGSGTPFTIDATFALNLSNGVELERIEVSVKDSPKSSFSIPGFQALELTAFETDLRTAGISFNLFPTAELAEALPFLKGKDARLRATVQINFEIEKPHFDLALILPSEEETKMFGKWPFTIQGIRVRFAENTELRVSGVLNLGGGSFARVGVQLVLTRGTSSDWTLRCIIDSLGGRIDLGDGFYIAGGLYWSDKPAKDWNGRDALPNEVGKAALVTAKNRHLWGFIDVNTKAFGSAGFYLRISEQGEASFWVGALRTSVAIPLGFGELQQPFFLLARNADQTNGTLRDVLSDVSKPISGTLRLKDKEDPMVWLENWHYSADIGSLFAGSGYMHIHDELAKSPVDGNRVFLADEEKYLTSIAFTDSGLLRIDAFCRILDLGIFEIAIGIDFPRSRFSLGFQLPGVKYPPTSPTFELSPGFLGIGFGFKDIIYAKASLGWPISDGATLEPDWDRAIKVYWADAWPINTFWGGIMSELEIGGGQLVYRMGIALRAGWTKTYNEGFKGVASASASLGVAVGGSTIYRFRLGHAREKPSLGSLMNPPSFAYEQAMSSSRVLRAASASVWHTRASQLLVLDSISNKIAYPQRALVNAAAVVANAAALLEDDMRTLAGDFELAMVSTLYADAWGSASVQVLGVTIASVSVKASAAFQICGDTTNGIRRVYSVIGFHASITILCVTYSADVELDLYLVDRGGCKAANSLMFLPFVLPDGSGRSQGVSQ